MNKWLKGLIAAVITAISNSGLTYLATLAITPDALNSFNASQTSKIFLILAVISGVIGMLTFTAKNPMPTDDELKSMGYVKLAGPIGPPKARRRAK